MKTVITKMNRTLFELLTGIMIFGIICQLFVFWVKDRADYSAGLWIGILTAGISAYHMWRSLDRGLDLGEKGAVNYLSRQNIIRYVFITVVLIATAVTGIGNPLSAFLGIMGLKVSAYMNAFTRKISKLLYGEEILPELIIEEPACEQEIRR
ncbi:MAG: hypothetical protein J5988_03490 [Eubacterium sp.]|nr:hypothetical protein [Lachnospiraceae bacterium]MBO5485984.1 hypothetical protein [Eubacterium sp.]